MKILQGETPRILDRDPRCGTFLPARTTEAVSQRLSLDDQDRDLLLMAWNITKYGYAARRAYVNGRRKNQMLHRAIAERMVGRTLERHEQVDHKNHIRTDNRRCNLRVVSHDENLRNLSMRPHNTTGFRGVSFSKAMGKYMAGVKFRGKSYYCGYFDSPADAGRAAAAKRKEFGFLGEE